MPLSIRIDDVPGGRWLPLPDGQYVIGRGAQCEIRLDDARVSRRHAALQVEGERVLVSDLGSRNGTFLDGKPVTPDQPWQPGRALAIADLSLWLDDGTASTEHPVPELESVLDDRQTEPPLAELSLWDASVRPSDDLDRMYRVMATAGELLARPRAPDAITEPVLDLVQEALQPQRVMLLLRDGDGTELRVQAVRAANGQSDRPTVLSSALAARVLRERRSFLVRDAMEDPELRMRESIIRTHIRTALVVPLFDNEDVLGILYTDRGDMARPFTTDDLRILTILGNFIAMALTQARLREVEEERERLAQELVAARGVIGGILGQEPPHIEGWQICHHLEPCTEVGGDFYDVRRARDGRWCVLLGDVSGHGLGAALLVAQIVPVVRMLLDELGDPLEILQRLNTHLCAQTAAHAFTTMFLGLLDATTGTLTYVNAGHVPPLHRLASTHEIRRVKSSGLPVGMMPDAVWRSGVCQLDPGDCLLVCSDGVVEAVDAQEEMFDEERLCAEVTGQASCPPAALLTSILTSVAAHRGDVPADDDVTLLVVHRDPAGGVTR